MGKEWGVGGLDLDDSERWALILRWPRGMQPPRFEGECVCVREREREECLRVDVSVFVCVCVYLVYLCVSQLPLKGLRSPH